MNERKDGGRAGIEEHEGKKYLRRIKPASKTTGEKSILVDVYCVLNAFSPMGHEVAHAVKKLLCAGERGKGDQASDLKGAIAAINRALDELEE